MGNEKTCEICQHYQNCKVTDDKTLPECPARSNERKLLEALEAAEWGFKGLATCCPVCGEDKTAGHEEDCILAAALKKAREG